MQIPGRNKEGAASGILHENKEKRPAAVCQEHFPRVYVCVYFGFSSGFNTLNAVTVVVMLQHGGIYIYKILVEFGFHHLYPPPPTFLHTHTHPLFPKSNHVAS